MNNLYTKTEKHGPILSAIIITSLFGLSLSNYSLNLGSFHSTVMTVLSILIGFLMTSWSVLITRPSTSKLGESKYYKRILKKYFSSAIFACFIALLAALFIELMSIIGNTDLINIKFLIVILLLTWAILLTIRASFLLFYLDKLEKK